ncbi:MAG: hypothetical protein ACJ76H_08240 [Bacteriovoracaceae bacterium]
MKISLRILPIVLFFLFYGLIQVSFSSLKYLEEKEDEEEIIAIEQVVIDRFERYLALPQMVSVLGAQFLGHNGIMQGNYELYAGVIQRANPEFIGFNIVDHNGLIVRTFPKAENAPAAGRITQNIGYLQESLRKNEAFLLSPPFRLFQGEPGFVFYQPVYEKNKFAGWYAVVISSEAFLQKFRIADFVSIFDLVIIDQETGRDYFSTSIEPRKEAKVYSKTKELYGRKMVFKTWRKNPSLIHTFPWYFSIIISLILAGAFWFILKLYDQRKKARSQLQNISVLLRVTSKEALSNLIEIHSEFNRLNLPEGEDTNRISRDINYLTNLVEQIDLLQTMAHSREGISAENHNFVDIMRRQIDIYREVFERKNIHLDYNEDDFKDIVIHFNDWMFENSVVSNVISHLLIHIENNSTLKIENRSPATGEEVVALVFNRHPGGDHSKIMNRRIEVARRVMELHRGDLKEEFNGNELTILLICYQK